MDHNVEIVFMYGTLKVNQWSTRTASLILQKLLGELKSQGELIF